MKKLIIFILLFVGIIVLSACKPTNSEIDCTLNPEHEDCVIVDPCEETPDAPECNLTYTYEDTFELLQIENDEVDDFESVFAMMNTIVVSSSNLFDIRKEYAFNDYYYEQTSSQEGLTKEELLSFDQSNDILLAGIELHNFTISGEVSRFSINLQDEEFVENQYTEAIVFDEYLSTSILFVNEDSFRYSNEMERIDTPGVIESYYEMTLVVRNNRLVFEVISFTDISIVEGFDYSYMLYDSEVGYIDKDISAYNDNLVYYENKVDLNEQTAETKQFSLGGFHTYQYSFYDLEEEFYYQRFNSRSQIGNRYGVTTVSFYDEFDEIVSIKEFTDLVEEAYVPTSYTVSYNILYLNDWDIVYGDHLIQNNQEVAYVTTSDFYSIAQTFMAANVYLDQEPTETEFSSPFPGLTFDRVQYQDLIASLDTYSEMENPVFYVDNVATVEGVTYDVRTELLDLFLADLPQIVLTNVNEHMMFDQISFGGEDVLPDVIDCEVTPEHRLCPTPE